MIEPVDDGILACVKTTGVTFLKQATVHWL